MPLIVNEIFYSIQGESSYAGRPCVFVRLTGCNLRCSYCDTQYAYYKGLSMDVAEILEKVKFYGCSLMEITGGEPLLQRETPALIQRLLDEGFQVLLETNGSMDIDRVNPACIKIIDIKCPSSGEEKKNNFSNLKSMGQQDEIKFVIGNRPDYEYARKVLAEKGLEFQAPVFFSPVFGRMDLKTLAGWILKDCLNVKLQIQLHKVIWGPDTEGV
jgi:7-carboxy-7-deazaguanine synthase